MSPCLILLLRGMRSRELSLALSKISLKIQLYLQLAFTSIGLSQISSLLHMLGKCWSNEQILILLSHKSFSCLYSYAIFCYLFMPFSVSFLIRSTVHMNQNGQIFETFFILALLDSLQNVELYMRKTHLFLFPLFLSYYLKGNYRRQRERSRNRTERQTWTNNHIAAWHGLLKRRGQDCCSTDKPWKVSQQKESLRAGSEGWVDIC